MATFTRDQLQLQADKEHQAKLSFYCIYWSYNGNFFSEVVQAESKRKAHIKLIDKGSMTENMSVNRYQFII